MKTTKPESNPENPQKAGSMTRLVRRFVCTPKCPHCGHDGYSVPYGMAPQIYECNKCKGTWTADMMEMEEIIEVSDVLWEYEDQLPPMDREKFDVMFAASKVISGVRMYPYVQDSSGSRVWISASITELPRLGHDVIFDDAFGHPGVDTCRNCESTSMSADWRKPCKRDSLPNAKRIHPHTPKAHE